MKIGEKSEHNETEDLLLRSLSPPASQCWSRKREFFKSNVNCGPFTVFLASQDRSRRYVCKLLWTMVTWQSRSMISGSFLRPEHCFRPAFESELLRCQTQVRSWTTVCESSSRCLRGAHLASSVYISQWANDREEKMKHLNEWVVVVVSCFYARKRDIEPERQ